MKFLSSAKTIAASAAVGFALMLGAGSGAQAAVVTYNLTFDHCTNGCGPAPFGTVTVTENAGNLDFNVQLSGSNVFNKSTGLDALVFNTDVALTNANITGLTSGFSPVAANTTPTTALSTPIHEDGFGDFTYGIDKGATGGTLLAFTIDTVANLTLADILIKSTGGGDAAYFAVDISHTSDAGVVTTGPVGAVPELSTWGMMLLGFAGIGLVAYRRSKKLALATI